MCGSYPLRSKLLVCLCALFVFSVVTSGAVTPAPFQSSGNIALNKPAQQSSTSPWSHTNDAQGAVDGIKNGSFGFHTNLEKDPWWQVDLLAESSLNEIRIYNRLDAVPERAETIRVLLSNDGRDWKRVFPPGNAARIVGGLLGAALGQAPAGPPPPQRVKFGGADGKPLVVDLKLAKARYVRLQLDENQYLHLDEVEIYGTSSAPATAPVQVAAAAAPASPAPGPANQITVLSGQTPSIPVGSYGLSRIELTRGYNFSVPEGTYEAGLEILPGDERTVRLGWDFNFGNNKQDRDRSISDLTITDIPSVVRPGADVSLAASMKAEWMSSGYGNNDREHKISLTGALGNGQWTDNGANPNVPAQGSFSTTNRFTVPREENGMVVLKSTAGIRMGNDRGGDMEVRFVYEPASAFLRTGVASLDLETGTLDGWFKTGNAFDFQPTYQDNPTSRGRGQPSNHQGTYWVGTFEKRHSKTDNPGDVQGDGPTGTLTSVPFTIAGRKMSVLVGGGCDLGTERVELAVAGRAVRKATGKCSESMERVNWDVSDYVGKAGQIRVIDATGNGWGHINYDDVQMTDLVTTTAMPPPAPTPTPTASAAPAPPPAATPVPSAAPAPAGFSLLSFDLQLNDANGNKMLESGERFNLRVTVKNTGSAPANDVRVRLDGDQAVLASLGAQKSAGNVAAGQTQVVDFTGTLPAQAQPRNAEVRISLSEGAAELPQFQMLRVGLAPADVRGTTTVLSEVIDVDYPPTPIAIPERTSSIAIIIGISNYRESVIPKLPYAGRDAEIFAKYLENVGGIRRENIKILSDDRAARSDIEEAVEEWLPLRATETSHVYFYYAGHGALDPTTGDTYLVPYEGSPDSPATRMYPIKRLYEKLGTLKVQNVTVFLDSCFSGGGRSIAVKGRPILIQSQAASAPPAMSSVSVLAAAGANQVSSDYEKTHHGMFTYFLLKGMRGEADTSKDSWVDLAELFNYVRDNVRSTSVSELNREQTPTLTGGPDLETKKNVKLFMVRK
jgi:hypothetical protein